MSIWPPPPTNRPDAGKIQRVKAELENYDLEYAIVPGFIVLGDRAILTIRSPEAGWDGKTLKEAVSEAFRPKKVRTFIEVDFCLSFTGVQFSHEPTLQEAMNRGLFDQETGEWVQSSIQELDEFEIMSSAPSNNVRLCINNTEIDFGFNDCTLDIIESRQVSLP